MRILSLLILLIGAAVGILYPWAMKTYSGHAIGSWRAQDSVSGFRPVDVSLALADEPVVAVLDVVAIPAPATAQGQSILTITAATAGRTVLARTIDFADAVLREDSPQTLQRIYRVQAGTLPAVVAGIYTFTIGPGDAEGLDILSVDLLLSGGQGPIDERAQPIGFSVLAVGFILLVISLRRRPANAGNPNSQPPPPRWGRGKS